MKRSLLLLAVFAAACGRGEPSPATASPDALGRAYFVQAGCAACHKVGDLGSSVGPDLTMAGFRHNAEWLDFFIKDPAAWKKDTLMPNKRIPDEARRAIVAWLAGQKGQAWPAGGRPWDREFESALDEGRVIYNRAGCVGCHGAGGAGGYPNNNVKGGMIPALDKVHETYTTAELIAKIKKGVPASEKADPKGAVPLVRMPSWGEKLDDAELAALAHYLMTFRSGDSEKLDW